MNRKKIQTVIVIWCRYKEKEEAECAVAPPSIEDGRYLRTKLKLKPIEDCKLSVIMYDNRLNKGAFWLYDGNAILPSLQDFGCVSKFPH